MNNTSSRKPGPNTSDGKARSSRNSTKHSLCANPAKLFPGETPDRYNAIRDIWFAEYDSESPGTLLLLEQLINCDRQVRYSAEAVMDAEIALRHAEKAAQRDETLIESLHKDLKNKLRYKTTHERSFQRAFRNIEQFGQRRVREQLATQRLQIFQHKCVCDTALLCKKFGVDPETVLQVYAPSREPAQPKPESEP